MKRFLLVALILLMGWSMAQNENDSAATGTGGAAATVDERATAAAINILEVGGNAVDAAVAAAAVLNVTDPFSAAIGGGGFMMVYLADEGRVIAIDGREIAPGAATPDMFIDPETGEPIPFYPERITSGLAVGVPGTLASWQLALERYGTMDLATVLGPAISIAEEGFVVDQTFHDQIEGNRERFAAFPATAELFLTDEGEAPAVGSIHRNPDLAQTFRIIAREGVDVFYRGAIGEDIVSAVQDPQAVEDPPFPIRGQEMTMADLDAYNALVREPTVTEYRGYTIYGMSPPSSGGLTIGLILNILEEFELGTLEQAEAMHLLIEASRLAYADRGAYMADADFVNVPIEGLQSDEYAATRRELIGERAGDDPPPGNPFEFQDDASPPLMPPPSADTEGVSTTHITTADRYGNAVAYTVTIESTGGSAIVVPGRGFILNNELTDFSATPGEANSVEPFKRPRSSIAPTIVLHENEPFMALGSPGGSTIITTVLQVILNVIDFGMTLPEAINAPRLSERNGSETTVEEGFPQEVLDILVERGHAFSKTDEIGAATGVFFNPDGTLTAAAEAERRGGGSAAVVNPASAANSASVAVEPPLTVEPPQSLLPPTTDEPTGKTVEINGANIYYEVYGEGEPLILLHGGLGNGNYWAYQIPELAESYQVIVMDSRGHGRSSFDDQPITYELMASDVLGLMDHLGIDKASIVGWSDGGIIGLELAINHPERLNKVVAYGANYDPSGVRVDVGEDAYFNAYIEQAAEDYLKLSPEPERWDEFLNNISTMWATLPNYSEEELKLITTPFLILDGETEEAIDLNQTKLMALLISGAELKLMPDTGHFAMMEQPDAFNRIVLDYLTK